MHRPLQTSSKVIWSCLWATSIGEECEYGEHQSASLVELDYFVSSSWQQRAIRAAMNTGSSSPFTDEIFCWPIRVRLFDQSSPTSIFEYKYIHDYSSIAQPMNVLEGGTPLSKT